jgi:hypothetical protein
MEEQGEALVGEVAVGVVTDLLRVVVEDIGISVFWILGGLDNAAYFVRGHGGMQELHR